MVRYWIAFQTRPGTLWRSTTAKIVILLQKRTSKTRTSGGEGPAHEPCEASGELWPNKCGTKDGKLGKCGSGSAQLAGIDAAHSR
jgi:hypothetical protein